jgi:hypothetical protein
VCLQKRCVGNVSTINSYFSELPSDNHSQLTTLIGRLLDSGSGSPSPRCVNINPTWEGWNEEKTKIINSKTPYYLVPSGSFGRMDLLGVGFTIPGRMHGQGSSSSPRSNRSSSITVSAISHCSMGLVLISLLTRAIFKLNDVEELPSFETGVVQGYTGQLGHRGDAVGYANGKG